MRRIVALVAVLALFLLPTAATAMAAKAPSCTKGDVQGLANATIAVAKQQFKGHVEGNGNAFTNCQFRLYDGNDAEENPDNPEIPNVFHQSDWFLGGIFQWFTRSEMQEFGLTRADAVNYLSAISDHLFWRVPGGEWVELSLQRTPFRSVLHPSGEVLGVMQHRFHIFPARSLQPGTYEWRWDNYDPGWDPPEYVAYGQVQIIP